MDGGRTRRLSLQGRIHGVSSSEVRRSATRATECYGVEIFTQTFFNRTQSLARQALTVSGFFSDFAAFLCLQAQP